MMRRGFGNWRQATALLLPLLALGLLDGCSSESGDILRPPDSTPPATILLRIDAVTDSSVTFAWRAPGDDGMNSVNRASGYDFRYSEEPFDESTWDTATLVSGLDLPGPPASLERQGVRNLTAGTTYYFSIRAYDEASNWSSMSSLIVLTVPAGEGYPAAWGGELLPVTGTTETGFSYQVRRFMLEGDSWQNPGGKVEVVIDGTSYRMEQAPQEVPGDPTFIFDTQLDPGAYDYYFVVTDDAGHTSRLPNPGTWSGPQVEEQPLMHLDYVEVPPDTFMMGNPDPLSDMLERPQHEVILTRSFFMDRYEVTNAQLCQAFNWALRREMITSVGDSLTLHAASGQTLLRTAVDPTGATAHGIRFSPQTGFNPVAYREDWPAVFVTWYGAAFYCNIRNWQQGLAAAYNESSWYSIPRSRPELVEGWRLPTEAEWEYVAQFNDARLFPSGNALPRPGIDGNFGGIVGHPTPVGQYPEGANALGIRDLSGNVWEWCNDWKGTYPQGPVTNPYGPLTADSRIVRGGSWGSPTDELFCIRRFGLTPARAFDGLGFRCVRIVPEGAESPGN